ncbi:MAG TPA: pyruvate dehydrogenase complex E1 component subunit beta, partial [Rhodospirillum rubrum]|nr:pyruvate dehydrogenase complex E1 component subunit beta [Rhodospirillum rubrum]
SPTMTEGTLAKWLKKEGDTIAAGDVIAEIETDKATMEFEAVDEGVLGQILIEAGTQNVPVNAPIGILLEEGETIDDVHKPSASAPAPAKDVSLETTPAPAEPRRDPVPADTPL